MSRRLLFCVCAPLLSGVQHNFLEAGNERPTWGVVSDDAIQKGEGQRRPELQTAADRERDERAGGGKMDKPPSSRSSVRSDDYSSVSDVTLLESSEKSDSGADALCSPPSAAEVEYFESSSAHQDDDQSVLSVAEASKCLGYLGPGFLITIAYVDPGNFEVDMQAGAQFGSSLLWVLLIATLAGLLVQILCVRLAVTTGRHLSQMCRHEYTPFQSKALWLLSELAIIASDIPEVIGTAFALKMLFGIPVTAGILVTSTSAMIFLLLQQLGARVLECFFAMLVGIISFCFIAELSFVGDHVSAGEVFAGLFSVGYLESPVHVSAYVAVSMLGALVMPHNLFLHSALVLARDKDTDPNRDQGADKGTGRGIARNGAAGGNHDELKRLNETTDSAKKMGSKKKKGFSGLPVTALQTKLVVFYSGLVIASLHSLTLPLEGEDCETAFEEQELTGRAFLASLSSLVCAIIAGERAGAWDIPIH